ncbi:methionyl-tRNA formyltransferase [Rhizobium sp. KVB221]|uniref:Methionyl-tRNA formyltransferase n=1 Tax=Rhizobium setariae TaxID=2801340 RepID=A0A936YU96_9HYPH|nr:formyltransferase family protein [Rhizobium setariae]MBL0373276.1 methionyl-tRNA formyltransferase [Rhizobium setariae]
MRIVLVGAVESTQVALQTLIASGTPPSLVLTLPEDAFARHSDAMDLAPITTNAGIALHHCHDVNARETVETLKAHAPDLILVIGWSQLCKAEFRASARLGCIGFHPSALPSLRGRAVIPWTILTRQEITGSTFFWLDDGIDTGDILLQSRFRLGREETARSLYDKQLEAIKRMLPEVVEQFANGSPQRHAQGEDGISYCARRGPEDGLIDWHAPAADVLTLIRAAGDPYPGAFTTLKGERIVVCEARLFAMSDRYIGLTGQVQTSTASGFVVRCGDSACIEVTGWRSQGGGKPGRHVVLGRD